ncbi:hypothetical protein Tco_1026002 [Tanacetum coccineum]
MLRLVLPSSKVHSHLSSFFLQACTLASPEVGDLRPDAPTWCRAPFEPEGLLSSISSILSGVIGIHYGHVLIHFKGHVERLKQIQDCSCMNIILKANDKMPSMKQCVTPPKWVAAEYGLGNVTS